MSFSDLLSQTAAVPEGAIYFGGLLSVALLAFRPMAGRGIPVVLSLLWLWAAASFLPAPMVEAPAQLVAICFALQGILLLFRSLMGGNRRMTMPPPVGIWHLVGGLLIGYALVFDPLLRASRAFAGSGSPAPFSLVPLTLGLLLFLEPLPRYLLVLPLVWAFFGGAGALDPRVGFDLGLATSVLVGVLFVMPRRQNFTDAEGDLRLETWPAYAARTRRSFGRELLLLILAGAMLAYLALRGTESIALVARWPAVNSGVLTVLALAYWLWLPAWLGPAFRRLAWGVTVQLRRAKAGLRWWLDLWPAWLLACAAVLLTSYRFVDPKLFEKKLPLLVAGGALALVVLLYVMYRARRRLVILDFVNYTGDETLKERGKGIASRLRNELAGISALYRTIDEALPVPSGEVIPINIGVEDSLDLFQDAVGPDSTFRIWKLEVPVGFLFRWLGRLVGGPRLTGSLHREGGEFLLLADYAGGGRSASWRIPSREIPADEPRLEDSALAYKLAENLAYRVVTAFSNIRSERWESVRCFTLGLRAYRATQLATQDPAAELRLAEREFIQALEHDSTFAQCHYNLGVVYQKLGLFESAEAAFREIIEADPEWSEAYYALANVYWNQDLWRRAAIYSRKAINVLPFDARPWNLSGIACFWKIDTQTAGDDKLYVSIIKDFEIATALAWRSLVRLALGKEMTSRVRVERYFASRCASNLALVKANHGGQEGLKEALDASREALRLSPRSASFHLILGEILSDMGQVAESCASLHEAFGDALADDDQVQRWLYLLEAQSKLEMGADRPETLAMYQGLLDSVVPSEDFVLGADEQGRGAALQRREYEKFLKKTLTTLKEFESKNQSSRLYLESFKRAISLLQELEIDSAWHAKIDDQAPRQLEHDWARAQVKLRSARALLAEKPKVAEGLITKALKNLGEDYRRQIRRQGLFSLRAKAYLLQVGHATGASRKELLIHALADAEHSVSQEPESPSRRWVLAEVHGALGDVEQATFERNTAQRLRGGTEFLESAANIGRIAEEHLSCARVEVPQDKALRRGLEALQQILRLLESKLLDLKEPARRFEAHAAAHYWTGRFYLALGDWELAISSLKVACSMGFMPTDVCLRLGVACFAAGAFDEAEKVFREAARFQPPKGNPAAASTVGPTEPFAEVLLSWAMVCAERDSRLQLAIRLARRAEKRWIPLAKAAQRRELQALHHECLGRIYFRQGLFTDSVAELELALRAQETARCHGLLAEILTAAGNHGVIESSSVRRRVQLEVERAERIRGNGAGGLFGVWQLLQSRREGGIGIDAGLW